MPTLSVQHNKRRHEDTKEQILEVFCFPYLISPENQSCVDVESIGRQHFEATEY